MLHQIICSGSAREVGQAHGESLRSLIQTTLERWKSSLVREGWGHPDAYLANFVSKTQYEAALQRWTPNLIDELRGIAEGSAVPYAHLLAYNLLDEEWWYSKRPVAQAPGCTVIAKRIDDNTTLLAQNMDIGSVYDGAQAVVHIRSKGLPEVHMFTYAGMVGLNGCNEAGIGVVVNNLAMLPHATSGLPVAAVVRGILAQDSMAKATEFVTNIAHASGQHYAIGTKEQILSFECSAEGVTRDLRVDQVLLHTNHPLTVEPPSGGWQAGNVPNSRARFDLVATHIDSISNQQDLESALSDQTIPVSISPSARRSFTFGTTSLLLGHKPKMRVTAGPPHCTAFTDVAIA